MAKKKTKRTYKSSTASYRKYGSSYSSSSYRGSSTRRYYRSSSANYRKYGSSYGVSSSLSTGGMRRIYNPNKNNSTKEVLANSRFYIDIDGIYSDLIIKSISGLGSSLEATEDSNAHGASKYAMSFMQATVTGVNVNNITITFVGTAEDSSLYNWYKHSHSSKFIGGMTVLGGTKKSASIVVYDQGGREGARWNLSGLFPVSYKCSSFSADSNELYEETIEFSCETMKRVSDSWF